MKKLDMRGMSHDILIVAFVAIFAISGVAYLVASHADSCKPTSGPMSGPASGAVSGKDCPTSGPVSGPLAATCSIKDVPRLAAYGQVIIPTISVTNTGKSAFSPVVLSTITDIGSRARTSTNKTITLNLTQPGQTTTAALDSYTVPYSSNSVSKRLYDGTSKTPLFYCARQVVHLPLPGRSTRVVGRVTIIQPAENSHVNGYTFVYAKTTSGLTATTFFANGVVINDSGSKCRRPEGPPPQLDPNTYFTCLDTSDPRYHPAGKNGNSLSVTATAYTAAGEKIISEPVNLLVSKLKI